MKSIITLKVVRGKLQGDEFTFDSRDICILGRSFDCYPRIPDDDAHQSISRYHCLLDISPPRITIRDFGSLNGTFLNGEKIGQRVEETTVDDAQELISREHELIDGDEIKVGESLFKVCVGEQAPVAGDQPEPTSAVNTSLKPGSIDSAVQPISTLNLVRTLLNKEKETKLPEIPHYRFLEKIGEGLGGKVYLVENIHTLKKMACKLMHPQMVMYPEKQLKFQREIDLISKLDHPNIVRFIDKGSQNDYYYFIMEFCDGGTVQQLIDDNQGKLPVQDALGITIEVLKGLEYAHQIELDSVNANTRFPSDSSQVKGVIHRDIKPNNLFLTNDNEEFTSIKIGDFGLAKAFDMAGLSGCTMTGFIAGSLCFVPRWQIINYKYTGPETDIWATAACCYYMITGKVPRDFSTGTDPVKTILEEKPVPIRKHNPDINKKLADTIDNVLRDCDDPACQTVSDFKNILLELYFNISE